MIRNSKICLAFLGLFALGAFFILTPAYAAPGDCMQWDVSGSWLMTQSNGTNVVMRLQQNGTHLQGVAEYSSYNNDNQKVQTVGGPVDGYYETGNIVRVTVYWSNSTAGVYVGQIDLQGKMVGFTNEKNNPENKANFQAYNGTVQCLSREVAPPPPAPAPEPSVDTVKAQSRVRVTDTPSTSPAMSICDAARTAKTRNSPAAPGLEKQCLESGGSMTPPPPPLPPVEAAKLDELAAKGGPISEADPLSAALRAQQPEGMGQRAFDIGMAAAENQTAFGPGKQHIHDSLSKEEQPSYDAAVKFSLERNINKELAAIGASIDAADPTVAQARNANPDVFYQLGFDIATGLFGDPALGAAGNTLMGPGSQKIRDSLSDAGKLGFDDSVKFHQARNYRP